jgi:hypothetical protein
MTPFSKAFHDETRDDGLGTRPQHSSLTLKGALLKVPADNLEIFIL